MAVVLVLVFVSVFSVIVLLMAASGAGASQRAKQAITMLQSALASGISHAQDPIVDIRKSELLSTIPWLNRWLLKFELVPRLRTILYQANVKWTASVLILMSLACFAIPAYLLYFRTGALLFGVLVGLALGFAPLVYVLIRRRRRFDKFEEQLPEALDLMVSALRAGHSLVSALGLVARESPDPIGTEFRICYEEQNYGLELRTAMESLVARVPLQDLRIISTAILIQKESGGNLAEVLDKVAHVIRERFRLKRQIRVHTAQGRLTGWILTFLPPLLGIALFIVSPDTMSLLWKRPLGIKLLYTSAAMTTIGGFVIRKIVRLNI